MMETARRDTRILLVEDNPTTLKTFARLVERIEGCVPVCYDDPADLVASLPDIDFDIAVLDYRLPFCTGLDLIRKLRASPRHQDILIVLVTADDEPAIRVEALEAGAIDFLRKPVDHVEFIARMRNLVRLREAQIAMSGREDWLRSEVEKATAELREREEEVIHRLTLAAGYKDSETALHTERVGRYSGVIARRLGLPAAICRDIELAAPMHDIGKVGIREEVLRKRGKLDEAEIREMRRHTSIGAEMLNGSKSALLRLAADIAASHHEYYDGGGYPCGLSGEAIPLAGRIVAIADTFDALTTERPYKPAWRISEAFAYIRSRSGLQFDPACVEAFFQASPEIAAICRKFRDVPSPAAETTAA
ncbi:HD domain-containing phosphohydrolase [Oricola sp.]|uniref:HD domain-containing phosphohydrolase n=1 Tax=Oricola sp. TaxID=1979950 RepID=UPI003513AA6D